MNIKTNDELWLELHTLTEELEYALEINSPNIKEIRKERELVICHLEWRDANY